jgi:RHS repeat-associated protein
VYGYDALARLQTADYFAGLDVTATPTRSYAYNYDRASNRTQKVVTVSGTPTTTNYSYNPLNQLTSDGTKNYSYDANGNLLSDGVNAYTWDRANRLLTFGGSSYEYNGLGQRVKQTVNSIATQYLLDVQPGLYKVLAATTGSNTDRYIHDPMGIAQHEDNAGNWHFLTKDGLGTVRHVYDDMLSEVYAVERDPYGVELADSGTNPTPFEYTGEPLDQNDLLHLRARYYDPALGTFVSLDPLETVNRYGYTAGDPINHIDNTGLAPIDILESNICQQDTNESTNCLPPLGCSCTPFDSSKKVFTSCTCNFSVNQALQYAIDNRNDNSSVGVGLSIGAGTDCANFASQILHKGGIPLTEQWYYIDNPDTNYLKKKDPRWAGAYELHRWLTAETTKPSGVIYSQDVPPTTTFDPNTVVTYYGENNEDINFSPIPLGITSGDLILIFYFRSASYVDHVSTMIGFGCPATWDGELQCPDGLSLSTYQPNYVEGLIPWIVDHGLGATGYGDGDRLRPYNRVLDSDDLHHLVFVRIPPSVMVQNVRCEQYE